MTPTTLHLGPFLDSGGDPREALPKRFRLLAEEALDILPTLSTDELAQRLADDRQSEAEYWSGEDETPGPPLNDAERAELAVLARWRPDRGAHARGVAPPVRPDASRGHRKVGRLCRGGQGSAGDAAERVRVHLGIGESAHATRRGVIGAHTVRIDIGDGSRTAARSGPPLRQAARFASAGTSYRRNRRAAPAGGPLRVTEGESQPEPASNSVRRREAIMTEFQVVCVVKSKKKGCHIAGIGTSDGKDWPKSAAIKAIKNWTASFFTMDSKGVKADVEVWRCKKCGKQTLRTRPDQQTDNNLDNLSACS